MQTRSEKRQKQSVVAVCRSSFRAAQGSGDGEGLLYSPPLSSLLVHPLERLPAAQTASMASHSMDSSLSVWSNASSSASTSTSSDGPVVVRHTPGAIHGVIGSGRRMVVEEGIHTADGRSGNRNGGGQREHMDARMQLELASVRRRLRATELAYKQLVSLPVPPSRTFFGTGLADGCVSALSTGERLPIHQRRA